MNAVNHYYCQYCKTVHDQFEKDDMVFKTGFIFISSVKYPLGVCSLAK